VTINLADHMMNLKGKSYLPVAPRIVAFREARPDWSIVTDPAVIGEATYCRATILAEDGRIVATAHKVVTSFAGGAFEKAETGAIGRALSLCGFGTLLALDMDEGEDIADTPVSRPAPARQAPPAKASPAPAAPSMLDDLAAAIAGASTEAELTKLGQEIKTALAPAEQQAIKPVYLARLGELRTVAA